MAADNQQRSLFSDRDQIAKNTRLMETMDLLNKKMGRNTVRFGAEGLQHEWKMRSERKSPAYTSCWQELPRVHAR